MLRNTNPINHVSTADAPLLLLHGSKKDTVLVRQAVVEFTSISVTEVEVL